MRQTRQTVDRPLRIAKAPAPKVAPARPERSRGASLPAQDHRPFRGWSLALLLICGVSYGYHSRSEPRTSPLSVPSSPSLDSASSPSAKLTVRTSARLSQVEPQVAATVNGAAILTADLNLRAQILFEKTKPRSHTLTQAESDALYARTRWKLLADLIDDVIRTQAVQEAEGKGEITLDAGLHEFSRTQFAQAFSNEALFRDSHLSTLVTRDNWMRRLLLWNSLAKRLSQNVTVTPQEVEAFYEAWPGRWKSPQGVTLSFEQARTRVEQDLLAKKRTKTAEGWLRQRRAESQITIHLPPPG